MIHVLKYACLASTFFLFTTSYSQKNQVHKMTNQETVITFLNGFNDPSKIEDSMKLLADGYKFKNPMVELNSKAEFIGLAQEIGAVLTGIKILNTAGEDDWVAAYYEFTSSLHKVEKNLATEWFRLKDGVIQESHLIYDASEWRKIYQEMEKGQ